MQCAYVDGRLNHETRFPKTICFISDGSRPTRVVLYLNRGPRGNQTHLISLDLSRRGSVSLRVLLVIGFENYRYRALDTFRRLGRRIPPLSKSDPSVYTVEIVSVVEEICTSLLSRGAFSSRSASEINDFSFNYYVFRFQKNVFV